MSGGPDGDGVIHTATRSSPGMDDSLARESTEECRNTTSSAGDGIGWPFWRDSPKGGESGWTWNARYPYAATLKCGTVISRTTGPRKGARGHWGGAGPCALG
jgi:hypothetical protein